MDVMGVSIVYIVYVLAEIGYIKDTEGSWSKGSPRNMRTNLVS